MMDPGNKCRDDNVGHLRPGFSNISAPSWATGRELGRLASGDAPEHDAGNQAGAAAVVVIVEPADDLAGGIEPADRRPCGVLHLGAGRDAQAAKREGDAGGDAVGVVGRDVETIGPVALVDGEAAGSKPVVNIGIEGDVWTRSGIELANGPKEALASTPVSFGASSSKVLAVSLVMREIRYSSRSRPTIFWSNTCQASRPGCFSTSCPYLA
jgi:hypothetical protein